MNLLNVRLAYKRINRIVSSEAKQIAWQAWLWLKKIGSESYVQLFFGYVIRGLLREVLYYLMEQIK
jgi:hypothetical protein